jgi:hypothetical protein
LHRELGEGDRHAPVHWLLGGQLVVASPEVLHEAMPGDDHPGTGVLLEPLHRSQPRLQPAMIGLDLVVGVRLGAMPRRWEQLLQHDRMVAARSVATSTGWTLVVPMAWSKNRWAAVMSRRAEKNASMTCPVWSTARYTYRHRPATFT